MTEREIAKFILLGYTCDNCYDHEDCNNKEDNTCGEWIKDFPKLRDLTKEAKDLLLNGILSR